MTRVKRGTIAHKRRKNLLKHAKGFRWGRKHKYRLAKEALLHAWSHAFVGRKLKKRNYRSQWNIQINAALRNQTNAPMSYSRFIHALKQKNIALDRKILSKLAEEHPKIFTKVVEFVTQQT